MNDVQALEQQLKNAKELIARRDMALKLSGNREFNKLIAQDFCVDEVARLAAIAGDPALDKRQREDALAMAQAPGHLKRYLSAIIQMGNAAAREMGDVEEALEEARAEEVSE